MKLFKQLTPEETIEYRKSARENYKPLEDIQGVWHPVYQMECVLINVETNLISSPEENTENEEEAKRLINEVLTMPHTQFMEYLFNLKKE